MGSSSRTRFSGSRRSWSSQSSRGVSGEAFRSSMASPMTRSCPGRDFFSAASDRSGEVGPSLRHLSYHRCTSSSVWSKSSWPSEDMARLHAGEGRAHSLRPRAVRDTLKNKRARPPGGYPAAVLSDGGRQLRWGGRSPQRRDLPRGPARSQALRPHGREAGGAGGGPRREAAGGGRLPPQSGDVHRGSDRHTRAPRSRRSTAAAGRPGWTRKS